MIDLLASVYLWRSRRFRRSLPFGILLTLLLGFVSVGSGAFLMCGLAGGGVVLCVMWKCIIVSTECRKGTLIAAGIGASAGWILCAGFLLWKIEVLGGLALICILLLVPWGFAAVEEVEKAGRAGGK